MQWNGSTSVTVPSVNADVQEFERTLVIAAPEEDL